MENYGLAAWGVWDAVDEGIRGNSAVKDECQYRSCGGVNCLRGKFWKGQVRRKDRAGQSNRC